LELFFVLSALYPADVAVSTSRTPYRNFVNLQYLGSTGIKKLSKKSKYAHHPEHFSGTKILHGDEIIDDLRSYHSQIGAGYDLARLGDIGEAFDQLAKYDKFDLPLDEKALQFTLDYFIGWIKHCEIMDLTLAQTQMNRAASSGFGAKRSGINSRRDPKMQEYLESYINKAGQEPVFCIISGSQKDELRPFEEKPGKKDPELKVARFFTSYPPEHTLLSCVVLGDFVRQFYSRSFMKDGFVSAIGDSPQAGSMRFYFEKMSERDHAYCTDTSAQDSSVPAWFTRAVLEEIMKKYDLDEEEQMQFDNVIRNSIYKVVNVAGYLYMVPRGLGSGDYLTTIINCMWRFYMIVENYKRPLETFFKHNTVVILGDDCAMSSDFDDLDLSSKYANIKWAGKPVHWDEMDFCSCRFTPDVHYDSLKMRNVLDKRVQKSQTMHPESEMQRLGGLLKIHVDQEFYNDVLQRMKEIRNQYGLTLEYEREYVSYQELWTVFNVC
jgi:hypothetical protein